jgi:hypothetical protein
MRETCSSGSVRGAFSNERPYRERIPVVAGRCGEGPLTEPIALKKSGVAGAGLR